jgi:hypothetical protein
MGFNECEALHELQMTPDDLREIATEMERKSKTEFYQQGQVIRYKFNHLFAFVYRPEKKAMIVKQEEEEIIQ